MIEVGFGTLSLSSFVINDVVILAPLEEITGDNYSTLFRLEQTILFIRKTRR